MKIQDSQEWNEANKQLEGHFFKAKFLAGSHIDRQTGAPHTHRWRAQLGARVPAKSDRARVTTKDWQGGSRLSQYEPNEKLVLTQFLPVSRSLLDGSYKSEPLLRTEIPKGEGTDRKRVIYIPSALDRTVGAVIAEAIEPTIEGLLHGNQHGYRRRRYGEVAGMPGIPQGSTKVVAHRIYRKVQSGWLWVAEIDICHAFPSVSLRRVTKALIRSGCPRQLAKLIVGSMHGVIIDKTGKRHHPHGIPEGHPLADLMFNLVVRDLHVEQPGQTENVSFADNFFITAQSERQLNKEINRFHHALQNLNLKGKVKQRLRLGGEQTLTILKEWEIKESPGGQGFNLTPTKRRKRHRKPLCRYREMR